MARRIILHLGAPKAGSTYLQRVLLQNGEWLAACGIAYPHGGGAHPGNAEAIDRIDVAGFEALFASGAETVILSHEDLFARAERMQGFARIARGAGVPIQKLVFLRPWSEFCCGDFSQHLKQNFEAYLADRRAFGGRSFEAMASRRATNLDPAGYFMAWSRTIPLPSLILAPHRAIRATVEDLLGAPGLNWDLPRHLANPSLRLCDCEEIAAMIDDPARPPDEVREAFRAAHLRTADPDPARDPERMARIEALFARTNRLLRDIYQFDNRPEAGA